MVAAVAAVFIRTSQRPTSGALAVDGAWPAVVVFRREEPAATRLVSGPDAAPIVGVENGLAGNPERPRVIAYQSIEWIPPVGRNREDRLMSRGPAR